MPAYFIRRRAIPGRSLADRVAALRTHETGALAATIQAYAKRRWRDQRIFRALNRMMFLAGSPERRWTVMRRFYHFPEDMIARFYASRLSHWDKLRLLAGKPPVPIGGALRALAQSRVPHR